MKRKEDNEKRINHALMQTLKKLQWLNIIKMQKELKLYFLVLDNACIGWFNFLKK